MNADLPTLAEPCKIKVAIDGCPGLMNLGA